MMNDELPPTSDEITSHRRAMQFTDDALRRPRRDYSDAAVAASLLTPIPDTGGLPIREMRKLDEMLKAYKGKHT